MLAQLLALAPSAVQCPLATFILLPWMGKQQATSPPSAQRPAANGTAPHALPDLPCRPRCTVDADHAVILQQPSASATTGIDHAQ